MRERKPEQATGPPVRLYEKAWRERPAHTDQKNQREEAGTR